MDSRTGTRRAVRCWRVGSIFLPQRDIFGDPALGRSLGRLMEILDCTSHIDGSVRVPQEER